MNFDPIPNLQIPLFVYGEPSADIHEVLPAVWAATEALASPDSVTRHHGLDALVELGVQRASPLVAYMIATCLNDPDVYIRRRVVYILADLLIKDPVVSPTPEQIRKTVMNYLHNMDEKTIYGLLEVALMDPHVEKSIYHLFNACPQAGIHLGEILSHYKYASPIRQRAIYYVGLVGFTEALPALERLLSRLTARSNEQYSMSFASASDKLEDDITPTLRIAIQQLSTH
jgi:HEAT repeat protein